MAVLRINFGQKKPPENQGVLLLVIIWMGKCNDVEHGFWERFNNWFSGYKPSDVGVSDLTPIQVLTEADFAKSNEALADSLYINYNHVADLRSVYASAKQKDETVVYGQALREWVRRIFSSGYPIGVGRMRRSCDAGFRKKKARAI